jgi:hypothetical protein
MKKRVLASILATACVFSCSAINVFAGEDEDAANNAPTASSITANSQEIQVTTTVKSPTIKVKLPTSTAVVINPYRISVKAYDNSDASTDSVVGAVMSVQNSGDTPVDIAATGKVTVASDAGITIADAAITKAATGKTLLLYVQGVNTTTDANATFGTFNAKATSGQLLLKAEEPESPVTLLSLAAPKDAVAADEDKGIEAQDAVVPTGKIRIAGDCSSSGWTGTETVGVTLTFKITAAANTTT